MEATKKNSEGPRNNVLFERAGKFLTFVLDNEEYGLEILKVREIIGVMDITTVPRMPDYIKGVINLRGKVITVNDLRIKFEMKTVEDTEETCIIVVDMGDAEVGIMVDKVSEVVDITTEQLEETPSFGTNVETEFILGMGKMQNKVVILLDIDKVLTKASDLRAVKDISEEVEPRKEVEVVDAGAEDVGAEDALKEVV
ncbi:MAG: purine-binding chemotaxis protein CheW [Bacteriovoracaceae bacterium]|nr:purine-binding chemotaxis protein CheW [Bacteriovoracaceae bacterium]